MTGLGVMQVVREQTWHICLILCVQFIGGRQEGLTLGFLSLLKAKSDVMELISLTDMLPVKSLDCISVVVVHHKNHNMVHLLRLEFGLVRVYESDFITNLKPVERWYDYLL